MKSELFELFFPVLVLIMIVIVLIGVLILESASNRQVIKQTTAEYHFFKEAVKQKYPEQMQEIQELAQLLQEQFESTKAAISNK